MNRRSKEALFSGFLAAGVALSAGDNPTCLALAENPKVVSAYDICFHKDAGGRLVSSVTDKDPMYQMCQGLYRELADNLGIVARGKVFNWMEDRFTKLRFESIPLRQCGIQTGGKS